MVLNQEENVFRGINLPEECSDIERNDLVGFDDSSGYKSEKGSEDIVDLLPMDPFAMQFNTGLPCDPFEDIETVSNFTCWIEDLCLKTCEIEISDEDKLLGQLNLVWASCVKFELEDREDRMVDGNEADMEMHSVDTLLCNRHLMGDNVEELSCFGCEKYQNENVKDGCSDVDGGAPADALFFVLHYLGVRELLSVEKVCKSLRDEVQSDPSLWSNIHIGYPLNCKLMDEDLLQLTNRAQGFLDSLSLTECINITNIGLKLVLESNLRLTKLSVPGCIRLNVDSILLNLRVFKSVSKPGIKYLRLSDHFDLTNQHLLEFKLLLGAENVKGPCSYKPRFYSEGQRYLSLDDERAIDIETCPRCQKARQVYDCPVKSCEAKLDPSQTCRACISCIDRCINCGCCLDNKDYEETFCLDLICLDCLGRLLDCQDTLKFLPPHTYFHQNASYHFVFCG